ncbi:MAG: VOC family protein [Chloroflexota bacterium]|nr:VOC family protein [Chloroflexota bacterium]
MAEGTEREGAAADGRGKNEVRALDYFVYTVSDMDRAVAFYRDTLGVRSDFNEAGEFWTEFDSKPVALALCAPGEGDWKGPPAAALAVRDVRAKVEELRAKGVPILAEPEETSACYMAFVADPDGNRVCLHQRKDGTAG